MHVTGEVIPLGSRLRQRREQLGLTQAQAALQLDVAGPAYRRWETEAAKPAPDRWRSIAQWLGISMNALLLAEQLIDEQEAVEATRVAVGAGMNDLEWDARSGESQGDYFSQQRAMIADHRRTGDISRTEATNLYDVLARIQNATLGHTRSGWYPAAFRRRLPNNSLAPGLARAALAATVIGIAVDVFDTAVLLMSELVTNCVKHSGSDWIDVAITLDTDVLRIEVSDPSSETVRPRTPGLDGGWGLLLIAKLATRWGVERHSAGKTIWIELDLAPPM